MVCEDLELMALDEITKVFDGAVDCKQFSTKGTVLQLRRWKLFRKKGEREPLIVNK